MTINAFPDPRISHCLNRAGDLETWLADCAGFYPSGTEALYWAYRGLGVNENQTIYLPSFNCGVEVAAALRCGADVRFFRTRADLSHDLADLERRLRARPGAVVVIHYFGFPQPETTRIAALCRELQVPWIADCAHAMFTRREGHWLHAEAPVSIFSLHKFLGLFDGGALWVNPRELKHYSTTEFNPPPPGRFYPRPYVAAAKSVVRKRLGERATQWWRKLRHVQTQSPISQSVSVAGNVHMLDQIRFGRAMSRISKRLLNSASVEVIINRRRTNYQTLAQALLNASHFNLLVPALPDGVCPLVLPISTPQRQQLWNHLRRNGIEPFIFGEHAWPGIDPAEYPVMTLLRDNIIGLPVQQDLTAPELEFIAQVTAAWKPE